MAGSRGLVQLYTGDGKGKTSAALGLALRAAGQGLAVCIVQFAKATDVESGELLAVRSIPNLEIVRFGDSEVWGGLMPLKDLPPQACQAAQDGFDFALKASSSGDWDVLILDEVNVAVDRGLLDEESVLELISTKPATLELVLTGRGATPAMVDASDLVTEMVDVRHPASDGVGPRRGMEY